MHLQLPYSAFQGLFMFALGLASFRSSFAATRCFNDLGCFESGFLHALPQEPAHLRTQYSVSCRGQLDDTVILATDDEVLIKNKIEKSCFLVGKPIKFITHGFNDRGSAPWTIRMRDAFLAKEDCNVIIVDWHHGATFLYDQAVANSFLVARQNGKLIRHLELVHEVPPLTIHLIGHSLGAHISGNTGVAVAPSRMARISGLDPAEPYFEKFNDSFRLDPSDAIFVDVIHTDAEDFTGLKGYGSLRRQGHLDFYPNGGVKQPGCLVSGDTDELPFDIISSATDLSCSHGRAIELFTQSIEAIPDTSTNGNDDNSVTKSTKNHNCMSWGNPDCPSWEDFESGICSACPLTGCIPMGYDAGKFSGVDSSVYLSTSWNYPFCGQDYMISVHMSPKQQHSYGRLFLIFENNASTVIIDFTRSNSHFHSQDIVTHVITTEAVFNSNTISTLALRAVLLKGSGLSSLVAKSTISIDKVDIKEMAASGHRWSFCAHPDPMIADDNIGNKQVLYPC